MPRARKTDPSTSHEAAASVKDLTETKKVILRLLKKGKKTDVDLVEAFYRTSTLYASESGIRSRRAELVEAGLVEDSGLRVRLRSGRNAILWKVA
jgi:hypothetical protein